MKDEKSLHEELRKRLWIEVWARVAGVNDCKHPTTATNYADVALKEFDARFPKPTAQ